MQEQQGNLEEPLSGLPGPRPFDRKKQKGVPMEDNNKELNDIVAKATEHLSSGKAFGGWTDKVDESAFKQMQVDREHKAKKIKAQRERESAGSNPKKPKDEKKSGPWDTYDHVEHDGASLDEAPEVATPPRQLKDKKTEVLVHDSKGKVKTIDKKDLEQYQKDNPGSGVAEGVSRIGISVREGAKGAAAGAALGSLGGPAGMVVGGLLGYALGDAGAAVTGIGKKKKTWDDK